MTYYTEEFTCPSTLWGYGISQSKKHRNTNIRINLFKTNNPHKMTVKITGEQSEVVKCKKSFIEKITCRNFNDKPQNSYNRRSNSPYTPETPLSKERIEELRWVLYDFQNNIELEKIDLKGYTGKERKILHIEANNLQMNTISSNDSVGNRIITVSKPDFLNKKRKKMN